MKNKLFAILFWILSFTWGIVMTSIGLIVALIVLLIGGTPHKNGCTIIIEIGGNWGGLELGPLALCGRYSKSSPTWFEHTRRHEFGHSIQHMFMGPFFIFLVAIPSAIRYWYRTVRYENKGLTPKTEYDDIWFEGQATKLGTYFIDKFLK